MHRYGRGRVASNLIVFMLLLLANAGQLTADPIGTFSNAAFSAKQLLAAGASSGLYWIDPDGSGANAPFQIYADMTTDGGGWTLGLNSLKGSQSSTTDMVANTGSAGLMTPQTRDLRALAIEQNADIRHRIVESSGVVLFDGYYNGNYHGSLAVSGAWTTLEGSLDFLSYHLGRPWSTSANDMDTYTGNCASLLGIPWYYRSCFTALPSVNAQGYVGPYVAGKDIYQWSIYVRENHTPPLPISAVPEPGSLALVGISLVALSVRRVRERKAQQTLEATSQLS